MSAKLKTRRAKKLMTEAIKPVKQPPIRKRNLPATPPANPPANPPAAEPPVITRAAASKPVEQMTANELVSYKAQLIAEADALLLRSNAGTATAEEEARLEQVVNDAEQVSGLIGKKRSADRLAALRSQQHQPTRPAAAPPAPAVHVAGSDGGDAEALKLWFRSHTSEADISADASYRSAQHGYALGATAVSLGCDFGGTLNRAKRRSLSKGGTNLGKETIPNTYSAKVTEYLTYFSPFLGLLDSETTADGNDRDYFIIDDTALMSSQITASGGSELSPTIPDSDIATNAVRIKCYDITSGYHKLTQQVIRDSAVNLQDKVAKGIGNSHARRLEYDAIRGSGTNEARGILTAATVYGSAVADVDADLFESVYFSVPQQYRGQCIWLMSDTGMARAKKKLKDTTGRTLFDRTIEDGAEVPTLFGRPVYTSAHMPAYGANAKPFLFFNPLFYMLRIVAGQSLTVLREKFYPHVAYAGGMAFGGDWLGPTSANKCIQLTASPAA